MSTVTPLPTKQAGSQDSALTASQLQTLTRDFNEVLSELHGDSSLVQFREEYEALFRSLLQSHESESGLLTACSALSGRISESSALVQQTVKEQHEQGNAVLMLNKEIADTQTKLDSTSVHNLTSARDAIVAELAHLTTSHTTHQVQISSMESEICTERGLLATLTAQLAAGSESRVSLQAELVRLSSEASVVALSVEGARITALRQTMKTKHELIATLVEENEHMLTEIRRSRTHLDELTKALNKPEEDAASFRGKTKKAKEEQVGAKETGELLQNEAERTEAELVRVRRLNAEQQGRLERGKLNNKEVLQMLEAKLSKEQSNLTAATLKTVALEAELEELSERCKTSQGVLEVMNELVRKVEKEVEQVERQLATNASLLATCRREKEALIAATGTTDDKVGVAGELTAQLRRAGVQKAAETRSLEVAVVERREVLSRLQTDKAEFEAKLFGLGGKQEEAKTQQKELEKVAESEEAKLATLKEKIGQQGQHCETVAREQLLLSATLGVSSKEVVDLEAKFEEIGKKIKKMTDKVAALDTALVQTHLSKQKLARNTEHVKEQIARLAKKHTRLVTLLSDQADASTQLDAVLGQGKRETQTQTTELNTLLHEREIITRQLSKRSNELALLYEKIRIQQSLLTKGASRYRLLLGELDAVELRLKQKTYTLTQLAATNKKLHELAGEHAAVVKQLQEEQAKTLLLSEELNKKVNVHAYRRLMEADPGLFEVLQKIQSLEKRIIARIDKIASLQSARDALADEIEETQVKLRRSRDVEELDEECRDRKQYIAARKTQIHSLEADVGDVRAKILDAKLELAKLADEKVEVMKKFFVGKAKERRLMDATLTTSRIQGKLVTSIPRLTGGGFCLSRPEY